MQWYLSSDSEGNADCMQSHGDVCPECNERWLLVDETKDIIDKLVCQDEERDTFNKILSSIVQNLSNLHGRHTFGILY